MADSLPNNVGFSSVSCPVFQSILVGFEGLCVLALMFGLNAQCSVRLAKARANQLGKLSVTLPVLEESGVGIYGLVVFAKVYVEVAQVNIGFKGRVGR